MRHLAILLVGVFGCLGACSSEEDTGPSGGPGGSGVGGSDVGGSGNGGSGNGGSGNGGSGNAAATGGAAGSSCQQAQSGLCEAGGRPADQDDCFSECSQVSDCDAGFTCVRGHCLRACTVPPRASGSGGIGAGGSAGAGGGNCCDSDSYTVYQAECPGDRVCVRDISNEDRLYCTCLGQCPNGPDPYGGCNL